ncbi:MAG: MBL fold metallo-hydrolase, partial [Anaerolineae bacterium]
MNTEFKVKFWGVRGGYPVPGPTTVGFGGNTTCVEVRVGGHVIILDAGTGIIGLGRELLEERQADGQPIVATLLFTHTHNDHTQGFPFFLPSFVPSSTLYIFGPRMLHDDLEAVLSRAMLPSVFPVELDELPAMRVISSIRSNEMLILDDPQNPPQVCMWQRDCPSTSPSEVEIRALLSHGHPKGGVLVYHIKFQDKRMVFATDTEDYHGMQTILVRLAQDADLLIHDAQYTWEEYTGGFTPKQGWGHSTWEMATKVGAAAGVKRLILTHHDPLHDDAFLEKIEQQAQDSFPGCLLARE